MTLTEYIKSFPRPKRHEVRKLLAVHLGEVSEVYVRSMCNGHKGVPAKFAVRIEQFTQGLVPRHVTSPDFYPQE